jgi:hypothetical protein
MDRINLREVVAQWVGELEKEPYGYWAAQVYPIARQTEYQGCPIQVEIDKLEQTDDYIHVLVSVDDGKLPSACFPASASLIIKKAP